MSWMDVKVHVPADGHVPEHTVDNVVNIDTIVRIGRLLNGCYIKTMDGNSIEVVDKFEEVVRVCLQADAKGNQ